MIAQGDVVWVDFGRPRGSEPAGRRPALVVQHDRFNRSRIATIVVAAITSNLALAEAPGNVRLRRGEGGLPRPSVVNVSQLATIDRMRVQGTAGKLSLHRRAQVWEGLRMVLEAA